MTNSWTYRGQSVKLAHTADIPGYLRPGEDSDHLVQEVLDTLQPWEGKSVSKTSYISENLYAPVVHTDGRPIIWGIHRGHKARQPGLSPFVRIGRPLLTDMLTVEVVRLAKKLEVVRAYPGRRLSPLPWQVSCSSLDESIAFWLERAYSNERLIKPGSIVNEPPRWFLRHAV